MDKNMINIDDLFRQRMSGREEAERAGAWTRMSELLDKNEDTKPAGFAWKRFAGVVASLLMVSAISVGGYKALNHTEETNANTVNNAANGVAANNIASSASASGSHTNGNTLPVAGTADDHHATAPIHNNGSTQNPDGNPTNALASNGVGTGNAASGLNTVTDQNNTGATGTVATNNNTANLNNNNSKNNTRTAGNAGTNHNSSKGGNNNNSIAAANHSATTFTTHNRVGETARTTGSNGNTQAAALNSKTSAVVISTGNKGNAAAKDQAAAVTNTTGATVAGNNSLAGINNNENSNQEAAKANKATGAAAENTTDNASSVIAASSSNKAVLNGAATHRGTLKHYITKAHRSHSATAAANNNTLAAGANSPRSNSVKVGKGNTTQHSAKTRGNHNVASMQQLPLASGSGGTTASVNSNTAATLIPANNNNTTGRDNTFVRMDTVSKITIAYHTLLDPYTNKRYTVIDTQSIEKTLVEHTMPFAAAIAPKAGASAILPLSAAGTNAANTDAGDNIVPLADYKVDAKKKKWNPEVFAQVFEDAKMNIAQAKMFPGLSAGINSFFTQGLMPGLHFGINNEIVFNERWSIMTELKYLTNFNNGKTIDDNYITGPNAVYTVYDNGTPIGNMYERDSVKHYFNFSGYGSLNLPISVRYSYKRMFFGAGLNFVYNFGVNTEEKTEAVTIKEMVALDKTPPDYLLRMGGAKIATSDFSSRFGIGYLFNAGYNISPAFSADVRMMQTFWDNAGSTGAGRVSKQIYKVPGVQFSVNYRFGQNTH